jgi:hypothetical protein
MNKYSLVKLMENDGEEDGRSGRAIVKSDVVIIPKGKSTITDLVTALEDSDNYGIYLSNLRNVNKFIQDEFTKHFGTPAQRRTGKFPIYTSDSAMNWLKDLFKDETKIDAKTKKVILSKILNYNINGDKIVITPTKENPKAAIKSKLDTILGNAGVNYSIQ